MVSYFDIYRREEKKNSLYLCIQPVTSLYVMAMITTIVLPRTQAPTTRRWRCDYLSCILRPSRSAVDFTINMIWHIRTARATSTRVQHSSRTRTFDIICVYTWVRCKIQTTRHSCVAHSRRLVQTGLPFHIVRTYDGVLLLFFEIAHDLMTGSLSTLWNLCDAHVYHNTPYR